MMTMKNIHRFTYSIALLSLFLLVTACGPTVNQIKPQQTVTVSQSFQGQKALQPTVPPYRCGAWSSNNAPGAFSTIMVYAKLTKNVEGVAGATAAATVHFQGGDVTIGQQPKSDNGGMVAFMLPLQGRQPKGVPATIDVTFNAGGNTVQCAQAFFTPQ
jgi:hypothetical protein